MIFLRKFLSICHRHVFGGTPPHSAFPKAPNQEGRSNEAQINCVGGILVFLLMKPQYRIYFEK